jgi:hypothetical protein
MIWKFSVNSERNCAAYAFEFSKNRSHARRILPKVFAESIGIPVVENLYLEEFPVALNQVEIGSIGRQEDQFDLRALQKMPNCFGAIVAGDVTDQVDAFDGRVGVLNLLEQCDGGGSVDRLVEASHRLQAIQIDRAIDVEPIAPSVARQLMRQPPQVPCHLQAQVGALQRGRFVTVVV